MTALPVWPGERKHVVLMFGETNSCQTNGSTLLGKIISNKNVMYLYLHFLVTCKSLIVRLSKSYMFNIFLQCAKC